MLLQLKIQDPYLYLSTNPNRNPILITTKHTILQRTILCYMAPVHAARESLLPCDILSLLPLHHTSPSPSPSCTWKTSSYWQYWCALLAMLRPLFAHLRGNRLNFQYCSGLIFAHLHRQPTPTVLPFDSYSYTNTNTTSSKGHTEETQN